MFIFIAYITNIVGCVETLYLSNHFYFVEITLVVYVEFVLWKNWEQPHALFRKVLIVLIFLQSKTDFYLSRFDYEGSIQILNDFTFNFLSLISDSSKALTFFVNIKFLWIIILFSYYLVRAGTAHTACVLTFINFLFANRNKQKIIFVSFQSVLFS